MLTSDYHQNSFVTPPAKASSLRLPTTVKFLATRRHTTVKFLVTRRHTTVKFLATRRQTTVKFLVTRRNTTAGSEETALILHLSVTVNGGQQANAFSCNIKLHVPFTGINVDSAFG